MDYQNKVVFITGAGKGIGKAIAMEFAKAKATVVVADKNKKFLTDLEGELKKLGATYLLEHLDITKIKDQKKLVQKIKKDFGGVDILINNAGFGFAKKFMETQEDDFDQVLDVNFKAGFFLTQQTLPLMGQGSSIIFITSIHAKHPSLDPSYDASKAAINSLVLNLSLGLAKKGIRVNAIAPGHIDVNSNVPRKQDDVPLGKRAGSPADIAKGCLFLADNDKAGYITGIILPITGGLHIPIAKDLKV